MRVISLKVYQNLWNTLYMHIYLGRNVYSVDSMRMTTGRRRHDDENTMLRWWKHDGTMVKSRWYDAEITMVRWWKHDGTMTKSRWYDGENTMVRWRNHDGTMVKARWYDDEIWWYDDENDGTMTESRWYGGTMVKTRWYDGVNAMFISRFHHRSIVCFTIVPSWFRHCNIVFSPSNHRASRFRQPKNITFVQTEHRSINVIPQMLTVNEMNFRTLLKSER